MSQNASTASIHTAQGNPNISWPTERPARTPTPGQGVQVPSRTPPPSIDPSNLPPGKKSLSGIAIRAHLLGLVSGISVCACLYAGIILSSPLWRVPFFIASLCLFHFLEFYITALYNTPHASISAFLLSANGWTYDIAHGSAIIECLISHIFFPREVTSSKSVQIRLLVGLVWMTVGQIIRSLAMAQAGSNFNHTVQVERKEGHTLVQHGVYSVFRHPSYFGFFWWGLGTQLVLGNVVCFLGFVIVLWRFFSNRIWREEEFLVAFFGDEYLEYRKRTWIGIPFI